MFVKQTFLSEASDLKSILLCVDFNLILPSSLGRRRKISACNSVVETLFMRSHLQIVPILECDISIHDKEVFSN